MTALHMLHLPIDSRRLLTFGRDHGLTGHQAVADTGYQVHALFAALFGAAAPKPFAVAATSGPGDSARLPVLAYSSQPLAALRAVAESTALPPAYCSVLWDEAADKPMPSSFPHGLVLGFEVRACPVVRLARGAASRDGVHCKKPGAEVDAFIAAIDRAPSHSAVDRQAVYCHWLHEQVERGGGAQVRAIAVQTLGRAQVFRRGAPPPAGDPAAKRPVRSLERPDVVFTGRLEVTDSAAFRDVLARGLGRHRAFGFGMLLLRPA
jgi:CRISPR system Cascade subunit CasE